MSETNLPSRRIDTAGVPGVPARPGRELEAFREAVTAIHAEDQQALARMSPALVGAARRWIARHTPAPAIEAPPDKPRTLTRNKWAKVADELWPNDKFAEALDGYHVDPHAPSNEATLCTPVEAYSGPARRPRTDREEQARREVISKAYRKHWHRGRNQEMAAAEAAAEIVKTYAIGVGAAEVQKFIANMDPAERLQLELNPNESESTRKRVFQMRVKPRMLAHSNGGPRPRLRQVRRRR